MSFLKNLFGRNQQKTPAAQSTVECLHTSVIARWDSIEDMGKEDRASYFLCEACGDRFTPEAARRLQGEFGIEQFRRPTSG